MMITLLLFNLPNYGSICVAIGLDPWIHLEARGCGCERMGRDVTVEGPVSMPPIDHGPWLGPQRANIHLAIWISTYSYYPRNWVSKPARALCALATLWCCQKDQCSTNNGSMDT